METEGANIPEKNKKKEGFENIGFNTKDFLSLLWRKKYWIILSVLVCTAASLYNYSRQVKIYGSEADVMLLFDNSGSSQSSAAAAIQELTGQSSSNVNFANEMEILRSPALMATVIERLNLNTTYTTEGFSHMEDLYGKSPVFVNFMELSPDTTASFTLRKDRKDD